MAELDSLSRDEIIAYMQANHFARVRHKLFDKNEYLYMADDGFIYDENGYLFENWQDPFRWDGMSIRWGGAWEQGWSVYNETEG